MIIFWSGTVFSHAAPAKPWENSVEPWEILTPLRNVFRKKTVFPLKRKAMGAKPRRDAENLAGSAAEPWKSAGRLGAFGPLPGGCPKNICSLIFPAWGRRALAATFAVPLQ